MPYASQSQHKVLHKAAQGKIQNAVRNIMIPGLVSNLDPDTRQYNPFPTFSYTGLVRPIYPLSPMRTLPKSIKRPDWAETGVPVREKRLNRSKIDLLNAEGQQAMRKVCRLAREVLDITAAELKPGITTDYLDEVCHRACVERDVSMVVGWSGFPCDEIAWLTLLGVSVSLELQPLSQVIVHVSKRNCLPWDSRSADPPRRRYPQPRHFAVSRRVPRRSERNLLHWRPSQSQPRCGSSD